MTQHRSTSGFTLVELSLSMSFVAMLLLAIAMLIIQLGTIYNKGITLREVNQTGQLISSDIQRKLNITASTAVSSVTDSTEGGRLCIGTTVYAWNYGDYLGKAGVFNHRQSGTDDTDIRLVKFQTTTSNSYCEADEDAAELYLPIPNDAEEFIGIGDRGLAIRGLTFDPKAIGAEQTMYSVSILLGTNETDTIDASGYCKPPKNVVDDQYCAVNEFKFVARSGSKSE